MGTAHCMDFHQFNESYLHELRAQEVTTEAHFVSYFTRILNNKLRRRLACPEHIKDVQQETLLRAWAAVRAKGGVRQPERFGAFASLSLQFPDLAVQQLETAIKKQGLRGAAIGGSVLGEDFADPKFHPVWAKAEELGAVLFVHPQSTPELAKRFKGNGWLSNTVGNPLETTIALQHLIFEGTLDRFPGLKVLAAHGGGYLPSYAARGDHACFVSPQNCNPDITLNVSTGNSLR